MRDECKATRIQRRRYGTNTRKQKRATRIEDKYRQNKAQEKGLGGRLGS